jgi:hypothetical protein
MANLTYSEDGLNLTKQFEGFELNAYADSGGVWTIGYGHTGPGVCAGLIGSSPQGSARISSMRWSTSPSTWDLHPSLSRRCCVMSTQAISTMLPCNSRFGIIAGEWSCPVCSNVATRKRLCSRSESLLLPDDLDEDAIGQRRPAEQVNLAVLREATQHRWLGCCRRSCHRGRSRRSRGGGFRA